MQRRDFLKGISLAAAGGVLAGPTAGAVGLFPSLQAAPEGADPVTGLSPVRALDPVVSRPITGRSSPPGRNWPMPL